MPIGDTVCVEPVIGAVIAEVVKETARFRFIPAALPLCFTPVLFTYLY